jgi:hypothetical protein
MYPATENIAHVDVDGSETSAGECGGHFDLTVDALLTQYGNTRADAAANMGGGNILVDVEAEQCLQAGVGVIGQELEFLVRTIGVVAQALDVPAGFAPGTLPACP